MPWLVSEDEDHKADDALLLIHIPRTGGTSLSDDFEVPRRAREGRCCCGFAFRYFFYRYDLQKTANFPYKSYENLIASCSLSISILTTILLHTADWQGVDDTDPAELPITCESRGVCLLPYIFMGMALCTACISTFFFTAPMLRARWVRRIWLGLAQCCYMYNYEILTGGCYEGGLLMHLTAEECIRFGYVTRKQMARVSSMAFVRNPYQRMISLYQYSRAGPLESFETFVRRWYGVYVDMNSRGEWGKPRPRGEVSLYCHRLPATTYVFEDVEGVGPQQLVKYVIRLEDSSVRTRTAPTPLP